MEDLWGGHIPDPQTLTIRHPVYRVGGMVVSDRDTASDANSISSSTSPAARAIRFAEAKAASLKENQALSKLGLAA